MFLLSLLIGLAAPFSAMAENVVTLTHEDLPRLIKERNKNVSGTKLAVEASDARTGYLARSYLPVIGVDAGGERFRTGFYSPRTQPYGGVEAKINLFRGGRDSLEEDIRESQKSVSEASAKRTEYGELFETRRVYWMLVSTREQITVFTNALKQNEKNLQAANLRIRRGLTSETDRLEFQIYRSQLDEELESLKHQTLLLEIELAAHLGMRKETKFKTPEQAIHDHNEDLLKISFDANAHPDVAQLRANSEIAGFQRSQENRWWAPSVDAYGGYFLYTLRDRDYLGMAQRDEVVGGVRLTFQLFDGLQANANASAFSKQSLAYEEQAEQRAKSTDAAIAVAKEDLKHDHELLHYSEERIAQGQKYLSRTFDEYSRGVKNSIDVLGATQRHLGFVRQYAERKRDYQITKSRLLALLGK